MSTGNREHQIAKEVLKRTATVRTGVLKPYLRRPFADPEILALLEFLDSRGLDKDKYPQFYKLMEAYLRASEQKNVSEISESSKFNLVIASGLETEAKDLPPIFTVSEKGFKGFK